MIKMSDESIRNPALKAAHDTCEKLLLVIRQDSKDIDQDILENHAVEYYGSICSTMMNTILINVVKGLEIPTREERDDFFKSVVAGIAKITIDTYTMHLYSH